jgi:arginyl-tRNA--protein-N-Asp/Glu arginylyltransferase
MRYKNRFQPQEHLTSKGWVRTEERPEAGCQKPEGNRR